MTAGRLTQKQENFCLAYIETGNASEAYRRAYNADCMKSETVNVKASQLLKQDKIRVRLEELQEQAEKKAIVTKEYVLQKMVDIAEMDVKDILNDDMSFRPVGEWPKTWCQFLSGVDIIELQSNDDVARIIKKIKWPDKVKNLELIGKHLGMFTDKLEVKGSVSISETLEKARKRVKELRNRTSE